MRHEITFAGQRWLSVKWWTPNEREDLAQRAALSVESLRKAGFIARVNEVTNEWRLRWEQEHGEKLPYTVLLRVEVFGNNDTLDKARNHLRGFWAALDSRGMTPDYVEGFHSATRVMHNLARPRPERLPQQTIRRLKA